MSTFCDDFSVIVEIAMRLDDWNETKQVLVMDFDKVLDEIGEFGRYQKIKYYLLCLPVFFGAANSLSYVFTAGHQHYR